MINLLDTTFTIPVQIDTQDRMQNLSLVVKYLQKHFDTNIIIGEQKTNQANIFPGVHYMAFQHLKSFHRTKMLNEMATASNTPIIVNYDCDILLPMPQVIEAVELLRTKQADMVYPYDGTFTHVIRSIWYPKLLRTLDVSILPVIKRFDKGSVGGCVFVNKEKFIESGGENERMISYGPEDVERVERWQKLGYRVQRVTGPLFHIDHRRGNDSTGRNPHFSDNFKELEKCRKMTAGDLREYIDNWSKVTI